jgi:endogenous inhibitor of DNA gyrase (YacG/DUF329 family)
MPRKRTLKLRCPDLQESRQAARMRSFPSAASAAARLTLGKWASGAYVIPSPAADAEEQMRESIAEDPDEDS